MDGLDILKQIFMACLDSYIQIMASWVSRGELNDPKSEFFIKSNPKVFSI